MRPDYDSDEVIQEVQDQMYRREETRPKDPFSKLDQRTKFWVALVAVAILFGMVGHKLDHVDAGCPAAGQPMPLREPGQTPLDCDDNNYAYGFALLAGEALFIWLIKGQDPARTELTWIECMVRIQDLLRLLQRHPIGDLEQIPKGQIHIRPVGRKQWYEGAGMKRSFAVDIHDAAKDVTNTYFVEVDTITGDIITFREAPEGVYGDETKDIKLMPSYEMLMRKKAEQFIGRGLRR